MRNHFVKALFGRGWESMGEAKYSLSQTGKGVWDRVQKVQNKSDLKSFLYSL